MSSLAAARADNFYYPPEFDPVKHKSLNKFNGQHPLRERAAKLATEGILVIRFEMPFHIFCDKCKGMIAKGERFNADKKTVGNYYSTKILEFSMRHICGCTIVITTDPKACEYIVTSGAVKKDESYTAAQAEVIDLMSEEERTKLRSDAFYALEAEKTGMGPRAGGCLILEKESSRYNC
jgi:coiled-coil domain-containing protein 130